MVRTQTQHAKCAVGRPIAQLASVLIARASSVQIVARAHDVPMANSPTKIVLDA